MKKIIEAMEIKILLNIQRGFDVKEEIDQYIKLLEIWETTEDINKK